MGKHRPEIRKFILKRVPKELADDLLQEIWLAAWTSMAEFDSRSRFRTWLYGIAINKCKTFYRSQQRRAPLLSLEDVVPDRQRPGPQTSELEARLPSLIEALSDNHQHLL